jgi:hypothetical protein
VTFVCSLLCDRNLQYWGTVLVATGVCCGAVLGHSAGGDKCVLWCSVGAQCWWRQVCVVVQCWGTVLVATGVCCGAVLGHSAGSDKCVLWRQKLMQIR